MPHTVLASRKADALEAAATRLRAAGACGQASVAPLDVRNPETVRTVVEQVAAAHGRIDILVNNAAGNFYAPTATLSPNAWRSVVEIDLYGTFFCSQAVAPVMRAAGGGRIVNVSMTLHYRGWPQMAHATAAKAGVDALTRTLAVEWASWGSPRERRRARPDSDAKACARRLRSRGRRRARRPLLPRPHEPRCVRVEAARWRTTRRG